MTEPDIQAEIERLAQGIYIERLKRGGFSEGAAAVCWTIARMAHEEDPVYGSPSCCAAIEDAAMAIGMEV